MWSCELFSSLNFALSIMEILLCEVDAHFLGRFAPIILANPRRNSMYGESFGGIERENVY